MTRDVRVGERQHTSEVLANAARQAAERGYDRFLIVDADAHHYETESWHEITSLIDDPVIRQEAGGGLARLTGVPSFLPLQPTTQDVSGRVLRYRMRRLEQWEDEGAQRDTVVIKRAMRAMGIDYQVVFPTPMLTLGLHPVPQIETALARAYARWITGRVLDGNPEIRTMLYLPFSDPEACVRIVEEHAANPAVVGFMITSVRYKPVWHNDYARLYRAIEESGKPLGFHAGFNWIGDRLMESLNRFVAVHALGFCMFNLVHLTNWVINGLPERYPRLRVIWIESGLAWLPFLMQRLDHDYVMRPSEAPLLKRRPSEYIRDMHFTSQPIEIPDDLDVLRTTFDMIDAENSLLYASDYPHWDFDLPSTIYDLPFLSEEAKRKILGGNAARLFDLPDPYAGEVRGGEAAAGG